MSLAAFKSYDKSNKAVIVIGKGLIGSAVVKQLSYYFDDISHDINKALVDKFNWNDSKALIRILQEFLLKTKIKHLEVVWAAGKAGFGATDAQMSDEYDYFESTIAYLATEVEYTDVSINLLSSAGGIYENSGFVDDITTITPQRPYAKAKIEQEQLLYELALPHRIYRVSTVYGAGGSRIGLINAMMHSAHTRKPMVIYANQNTVRDYIYNVDVGKKIVNDIILTKKEGTYILANGRVASISLLLNLVQQISKKRVPVSFLSDGTNDKDIAFARNLIENDICLTSLEEGIRILYSIT